MLFNTLTILALFALWMRSIGHRQKLDLLAISLNKLVEERAAQTDQLRRLDRRVRSVAND